VKFLKHFGAAGAKRNAFNQVCGQIDHETFTTLAVGEGVFCNDKKALRM
jgi:hypothetical protein